MPLKVRGLLRHAANLVLTPEVLANYDASVKSKIIHCDISSGNILILPVFVKHETDTGGVLEIAKSLGTGHTSRRAWAFE